ncbi:hypothetical protein [Streptomyces sp. NPDC058595]|uniref:hypothetical protein n=1 Tax=Streptomyces sp. NPDC058595 TaxID=3346550 RepID=UPI003654B59B
MSGIPTEPAAPAADDRALAYPEPEPHPLWSHSGRSRYGPLTPEQRRHNQKVLLRGLREDREAA